MAIKIKSKKNLVDFVPKKKEKIEWIKTENGKIQIIMRRDGALEKTVRIFKKTPKTFKVDLDEYGSYVWEKIDGKKSIFYIGSELRENFGETIEPVYIRLGQFINLLKNNEIIEFV